MKKDRWKRRKPINKVILGHWQRTQPSLRITQYGADTRRGSKAIMSLKWN